MLVIISHIINIVVAGFFGLFLFSNFAARYGLIGSRIDLVYGENTNARRILACVYLSISLLSVIALFSQSVLDKVSIPLFAMQIIYKILTLFSVGTIKHPVVAANIAISLLHAVSIYTII